LIRFILKNFNKSKIRTYSIATIIILGIIIIRFTADPGIEAIEAVDPARTGFLGGFGLTDYIFMDSRSYICWWT
jgi:branched-chain amino acid transport system permease protein